MPSFRAILDIGNLHAGHQPDEVMSAAVRTVSRSHTVESTDIQVISGVPQIVLRFTVEPTSEDEENSIARRAGREMTTAVAAVAQTGGLRILRRVGGRWKPVV